MHVQAGRLRTERACQENCVCDPEDGSCSCDPKAGATCTTDEDTEGVCCGDGTCCNGCCGEDGTCGACLVFATSTLRNGALGGLNGADAICQERAGAGGLPGTYRAWLSDGTGSPSTRFRRSGQGYRLPDAAQTSIATDWTDLTDGKLRHAINVTELGETVPPPPLRGPVPGRTRQLMARSGRMLPMTIFLRQLDL